jgi:hypothetical protein
MHNSQDISPKGKLACELAVTVRQLVAKRESVNPIPMKDIVAYS